MAARIIDATGQFLIPGLWDMHVHSAFGNWFPGGRDVILPLFIANGVTGVRDMGGDLPVLMGWRTAIPAGPLVGPRMIVAGPMLDGYLAGRQESSVSQLRPGDVASRRASRPCGRSLSQHVDFIKVQSGGATRRLPRRGGRSTPSWPADCRSRAEPRTGQRGHRCRARRALNTSWVCLKGARRRRIAFIAGTGNMQFLLASYDPATLQLR